LLRTRRERPRNRGGAEKRDEFSSLHVILARTTPLKPSTLRPSRE
jgi:hypothetical protein